jgi:NCAIR mutase (PurE)-related protein
MKRRTEYPPAQSPVYSNGNQMHSKKLKEILSKIENGRLTADEGWKLLKDSTFEDIHYAKIDHHREKRTGIPEVIFAPGKTEKQIMEIFRKMHKAGSDILVSKVDKSVYNKLKKNFKGLKYNESARMIVKTDRKKSKASIGRVAVVTGGTSDMNVAEEAAVTIEVFGGEADRIYDVGVAGIHRLLAFKDRLLSADVIIVAAGMEGALPSVVGGLVTSPVIAVPTSIGYGASFGGIAALLGMLNSCAPGVTVVNIDNGFGAAMAALKILNMKRVNSV